MYVFSFEKLEVWKEAIRLSKDIYKLTVDFPKEEKYGLISQLRRASNSIGANLAEGTSRITNKDNFNELFLTYESKYKLNDL